MDVIQRLQQWYLNNCNGDWEHTFGIRVETMDNPGWLIEIDLEETFLEDATPGEVVRLDRSDTDWLACEIKERKFIGYGGPSNLAELIQMFFDWEAGQEGARRAT